MTGETTGAVGQLAPLVWLADSLRNQGIAVPNAPSSFPGLEWTEGLTHYTSQTEYASRSIAVAPNGLCIAIGTKAGSLQVLSRSRERQPTSTTANGWFEEPPLGTPAGSVQEQEGARLYAIRGLGFVANRIVVAGFGPGYFRLYDLDKNSDDLAVPEVPPGASLPYVDRCRRVIPLLRSFRFDSRQRQPIAVALTSGEKTYVCDFVPAAAGSSGGVLHSDSRPLSRCFADWNDDIRLVGGVWHREQLWLLGHDGQLSCYAPPDGSSAHFSLLRRLRISAPPSGPMFSELWGNDDGLAVYASGYLTLILPQYLPNDSSLHEPNWLPYAGVTEVTVLQPCCAGAPSLQPNPIWMYVVTHVPGLLWIAWEQSETQRAATTGRRPPFRSFAAVGNRQVLHVVTAKFGDRSAGRHPPSYLAFTSRDERLGLVSFVEMEQTSRLLGAKLPSALAAHSGETTLSPGLALWLARRRLYQEFEGKLTKTLRPRGVSSSDMPPIDAHEAGLLSLPTITEPPPAWLGVLEAEDLRELARDLASVVRSASRRGSGFDDSESASRLKLWVLLLLHRATQIDPDLHPTLAASLTLELLSGLERSRSSPLRAFGEALRKWMVYGDSFNVPTRRLAKHAEWNRESRRLIDGVVFATRLLDQRVDLLATTNLTVPQPNPAIWGLAVAEGHGFTIQSHTDGRITACASDGSVLKWIVPHDERLVAAPDGAAIQHVETKDFRSQLWYGPFSRALALVRLSDDCYLLVFGTRGWPSSQSPGRRPGIHALLLEHTGYSPALHVQAIARPDGDICEDIFSLVALPMTVGDAEQSHSVCLIAGTAWGASSLPFLELNVTCHLAGDMPKLTLKAEVFAESAREDSSDLRRNPVGAVTYSSSKQLLFVGQDDGCIRAFARAQSKDAKWSEQSYAMPRARAAIRALASRSRGQKELLGFGTSDGTFGLAAVSTDEQTTSADSAVALLVHTRESAPVCGISFYDDESKHDDGVERGHVMALTQSGMICIWDASLGAHKPLGSSGSVPPSVNFPEEYKARRNLAGERLDHFSLGVPCRALSPRPADAPTGHAEGKGKLPSFVVGTADGQVRSYELSVPKGTQRRTNEATKSLIPYREFQQKVEPVTRDGIGKDFLLRWLRVAPIGSQHLVRYAIWVELRNRAEVIGKAVEKGDIGELEASLEAYSRAVKDLSDELFRRRPFSKEPIKIVWEEGAKVLNAIATHAIARSAEAAFEVVLLKAFARLGTQLSGLCNQWLGYDQALESTVLIHSFNRLMDWPSIVFVSRPPSSESAVAVRRFVLDELIRPRLFFHDPLVTLETLRAINGALERAIDRKNRSLALIAPLRDLCFFDLIDLVGTFAKKHEAQVGIHEPLCSEVARFFALCLAWLPDGVVWLGARVSVFGLAEGPRHAEKLILAHGQLLLEQLEQEFNLAAIETFKANLERYTAYLEQTEVKYVATQIEDWRVDSRVGDEQRRVLAVANALEDIGGLDEVVNEHLEAGGDSAALSSDGSPAKAASFLHSRKALRELLVIRRDLRSNLSNVRKTSEPKENPYQDAIALCDRAEAHLRKADVVFEPQRRRYLLIVAAWRLAIEQERAKLFELFRIIDRFNRHIYQAAADDLVASLQELAFRNSPISFSEEADTGPGSLRWLLLQRLGHQPVLKDVFQRGTRLVEYAHMSGTLLAVAKDVAFGGSSERSAANRAVSLQDIVGILEGLHASYGIKNLRQDVPERFLDVRAPGACEIWETILREWTRNVAKYGLMPESKKRSGAPPTLHVTLQHQGRASGTGFLLSMYGDRPFADSLSEEFRGYDYSQQRELIAGVRTRERNNFSRGGEQTGGFGLHLLLQLCKWMDLKASLELDDGGALKFQFAWHVEQAP